MISELKFITKELYKGKSVLRAYLNLALKNESLEGKTIDIGGGKNADYISFLKSESDVDFQTFDIKAGASVDFETDRLPATTNTYSTVLLLNVIEHIYNYNNILCEVFRITKPGGRIIGFVPFLMWYHPDHSDYFRYTNEALTRIFTDCGFADFEIKGISRGPFTASAQMIVLSIPKFFRVIIFPVFFILDVIFMKLRPGHGDKYVLGYYFVINK